MPGIWPSCISYGSISWHIDRMFGIGFVRLRRPELTAFLTRLPRTGVPITLVGMAQTQALVLHLATPAPAKRHKRGIAAYPLLATWCLHSRRRWIATKTTMCTGNGIGFHPIVRHHVLWSRGMDWAAARRAWFAGALRRGSLSPLGPSSSDPWTTRRLQRRLLTKARMMSQWSQVRQSRQQWQQKATQRADHMPHKVDLVF